MTPASPNGFNDGKKLSGEDLDAIGLTWMIRDRDLRSQLIQSVAGGDNPPTDEQMRLLEFAGKTVMAEDVRRSLIFNMLTYPDFAADFAGTLQQNNYNG